MGDKRKEKDRKIPVTSKINKHQDAKMSKLLTLSFR